MFSRIMDLLHPIFMWLNWAMCLFNLSQGNFTSAAIFGRDRSNPNLAAYVVTLTPGAATAPGTHDINPSGNSGWVVPETIVSKG